MYRLAIARTSARPTAVGKVNSIRKYTSTAPPPAPNPKAKHGSNNTVLYTVLGFAAAGTAYYYYTQQSDQAHKERLQSKAHDAVDSAKETSEQAERMARRDYEQLKVGAKDKLGFIKDTGREVRTASEERGRSIGENVEAKYESAKGATRGTLDRARDSTENLYREAEQRSHAARETVERKADEVKQGWFSWLGWGRGKADETKERGAERVANAADDVKKRAEKHT